MSAPRHAPARVGILATCVLVVSTVIAACSAAAAGPTSAPATPASTPARPTSWAAWIEMQGFGGSSGPNEVHRNARFIAEHGGDETLFDLDQDIATVSTIVDWLNAHPATPCWADYHATVLARLTEVRDAWVGARATVEAGHLVPADVVELARTAADTANDLPAPTACP